MSLRLFFIFLLCLLPITAIGDDIIVTMSVSQDVVGLGGQTYLIISVTGNQQNLPDPKLPNLSMFETLPQGTSTNISIVNGKMESSLRYTYLLVPRKKGTFVIKPAVVTLNHKRYESNEVTVRVIDAGQPLTTTSDGGASTGDGRARDMYLTAEFDKKTAYVNEQLILLVKFYSATKLISSPEYTAPQATDFWADMLKPFKTYSEIVNNRRYRVFEISTALFPTRAGELTIGRAMITAKVPAKRRSRRNDPFSVFDNFFDRGESVSVRSKPLKIKIKQLPQEGRPADFSGTVGSYKIYSQIDKRSVEVNQAVNVTYKINGTGNIKTVAEPSFGDLSDFRVYRSSSDEKVSKAGSVIGGTKIFEEVYMPRRAGKITIPAASLNFFDPKKKKYRTITTKPILLDVKPATEGEFADIPIATVAGRVVDPNARDIRYIKSDISNLARAQSVIIFRPLYFAINVAPVLLLLVVWVGARRREKMAGDVAYARSRRARKMARQRLKSARRLSKADDPAKFYGEIRLALFSYIADKLNISPFGLTGDRLFEILNRSAADEKLLHKIKELLKRADFAQYSASGIEYSQIEKSLMVTEQIMVELEGISFD